MERLQKVIAASGLTSRRKAEELIVAGKVKVNGEVVCQLGFQVKQKDRIEVNDVLLFREELVYYVINKPKKMICSLSDPQGRTTVVDLINCQQRIFPVGRLDYDTTGILILTNDGNLTQKLSHPKYQVPKTYQVTISGSWDKVCGQRLKSGITLDDGFITKATAYRLLKNDTTKKTAVIEITINEGHNRQIKRMMEALGFTVKRLHRLSFGTLTCTDLAIGSYRPLKPHELKQLKALVDK